MDYKTYISELLDWDNKQNVDDLIDLILNTKNFLKNFSPLDILDLIIEFRSYLQNDDSNSLTFTPDVLDFETVYCPCCLQEIKKPVKMLNYDNNINYDYMKELPQINFNKTTYNRRLLLNNKFDQ